MSDSRVTATPDGNEKDTVLQYLQWQRDTILMKTDGLDREQLNRQSTLSELTLAKLLKHLALVEDSWIDGRFAGHDEPEPWASAPFDADEDWEFTTAVDDEPDYLRELYRTSAARTDAIVAAHELDEQSVATLRDGRTFSLRWALLHLIEETARHAGHADLIREGIDGTTGE